MKALLACLSVTVALATATPLRGATIEADVVVFGGTSGGIAAAIQAQRMGKSAVIVEPKKFIGGLTTGGLGATDIGNKAAIGGISREFYQRLGKHYGTNEAWKFEPHVAENLFHEMIKEAGVKLHLGQRLKSISKNGTRIVELQTAAGDTFRGKMFIDATYEGDLMAKAGVSFHVGREANAAYGETLNGIRAQTPKHQFTVAVDPYRVPGDPKSGLLPFIQDGDGGKPGDGDRRLQAYNYRLCFTTNAVNRLAVAPPPNYDAAQYELLGRYLEALVAAGRKPKLSEFWNPIWMPNQKTDINNNGGFSTDFIGANYDYVEADYDARERIDKQHENYIRGFLTFMATSPRVPADLQAEMKTWGPCKDEFKETGGWPREIYVREARRMVSDYVMTEHHCRAKEVAKDPVGMAAYNMDSHNCQRIVKNGRVENEGDVQVPPMSPYPISYRAIVPKVAECENLFVPVCLSSTHIAYGSIRMEPVFMILGQSAATAAALAIDEKIPVQKVSYERLQKRLLADRQVLEWKAPANVGGPVGNAGGRKLEGILVDDAEATKVGEWTESGSRHARIIGDGYVHDDDSNKGGVAMTFEPKIDKAGRYEIILVAPTHNNRASNVPVEIEVDGKRVKALQVNQKKEAFNSLGKFELPAGKKTRITISNRGTDGHVIGDGVQVVPVAK